MSIIEVENLTKDYGSGRGVFDVSFQVQQGEVFGFLGPNGAGKSTTIRHLMGFSKPDKGSTKIFGKEMFENYSKILNKVGYVPGEIALPAGLTGVEFLKMMQDLQKVKNDKQLNMLLDMFELDARGETKRMSLGVKRKLAIVTAFMSDPEVLILDEPTSGLDPLMQEVFIDYIKQEKKRGKTILLSSHIFTEVDATCDNIAIIKDGRIVSYFDANSLKHAERKEYILTFGAKADMDRYVADMANSEDIKVIATRPELNQLEVETTDAKINEFVRAMPHYHIVNFSHHKETLEDYFMSYYKEDRDFGGAFGDEASHRNKKSN